MDENITIERVMRELHQISGFRISLHDTRFREIASYPQSHSHFCSFLQQHAGVREACMEADREAFLRAQKKEESTIYQCPFGLYEGVAPLYHFGTLAGYLMMGQTLDSSPGSDRRVKSRAAPFAGDPLLLEEAIAAIPRSTKAQIASCFTILSVCSEYITLTHRLNLPEQGLAQAVHQYIGENLSQKLSIQLLCSQFFCSRSTLLRAFQSAYGCTLGAHIQQLRLEEAKRLLLATALPLHKIASRCGFSDPNYFSKAFQKSFSLSPSAFRATSHPN